MVLAARRLPARRALPTARARALVPRPLQGRYQERRRPGFVSSMSIMRRRRPTRPKWPRCELSLLHQDGGAHLTRRHEGKRVFGAKADLVKKIESAGTPAALAHVSS